MQYRGLELYPFQEEAIGAVEAGHSVIVSAPTGAGKTIIAEYAIDRSLEIGRRIVYTSPIKALSNQKYRDFKERYGDQVGIMTGDVTLNATAAILIMTTEIFRNTIFEDSVRLDGIEYVIFDEVHYLGDSDRGSVWEESIIFAPPSIRFICLSATIANLHELRDWMVSVREGDVELIHTDERPVPLHKFLFLEDSGVVEPRDLKERLRLAKKQSGRSRHRPQRHHGKRHDILRILIDERRLPVLYFCFSRRKCENLAQRYQRREQLLSRDEQRKVLSLFDVLVERYGARDHPAVPQMRDSTRRGVLYHHAGMLPIFKDVIERLFTSGLVKLLFTTETFALGVNMPARCVVFDSLTKFNGVELQHITPLEYLQMAGRAGRQGMDTEGEVYGILDPRFDTAKAIGEILFKRPGAITSKFSLGYSTTLSLYALLGKRIEDAVKKSFLAFQASSPKRALADLRMKLQILRDRRYLDDKGLTDKGRFCSRINGFEIQLTELFWDGCFEDLEPVDCGLLCAAVVYQARKRDATPHVRMDVLPGRILNRANKRIREFQQAEARNGLPEVIKELETGLLPSTKAWMMGEPFGAVARGSGMQEGDLVRALRLSIQVLRQLAWALPSDHHVSEHCRTAIQLLNRDEVDAEKQLQVT